MPQFDDPGIPTGPRGEPLADLGEQLGRHGFVLQPPLDQPTRVQVPTARERDEPLGERTQLLRLRLGGLDAAVPEETGRHVVQRRFLVARRPRELATLGAMPHYSSSAPDEEQCGIAPRDRKSARLNSSHAQKSYADFCWKNE